MTITASTTKCSTSTVAVFFLLVVFVINTHASKSSDSSSSSSGGFISFIRGLGDDDQNNTNNVCQDYLDAFLNGTTDVLDVCEGVLNAYQAAGCDGGSSSTSNNNNNHYHDGIPDSSLFFNYYQYNHNHDVDTNFTMLFSYNYYEDKDNNLTTYARVQHPISSRGSNNKSWTQNKRERRMAVFNYLQSLLFFIPSRQQQKKTQPYLQGDGEDSTFLDDESLKSMRMTPLQQENVSLLLLLQQQQQQHSVQEPSSIWHCCQYFDSYYSQKNCAAYHNKETQSTTDYNVLCILFILLMCGMVRGLIRKKHITWLPEAGACILVGIFFGLVHTMWNKMTALEQENKKDNNDRWLYDYPHEQTNTHFLSQEGAMISYEATTTNNNYLGEDNLFFDDDVFLRILLPPIVFAAAVTINKRSFQKLIIPILLYAIGGTLVSSFFTGWMVHTFSSIHVTIDATDDSGIVSTTFVGGLPKLESYIFGALISSVDPVAILSVLQSIGMTDTDTLYVLIFGESLLNDGVSIVLFDVLVEYLNDSNYINNENNRDITGDRPLPHGIVSHVIRSFILVMCVSLIVGFLFASLATMYFSMLEGYQHPAVEVASFFGWALVPYYICDVMGFSGIVSLVASGFLMDVFIVGGTGLFVNVLPVMGSHTPYLLVNSSASPYVDPLAEHSYVQEGTRSGSANNSNGLEDHQGTITKEQYDNEGDRSNSGHDGPTIHYYSHDEPSSTDGSNNVANHNVDELLYNSMPSSSTMNPQQQHSSSSCVQRRWYNLQRYCHHVFCSNIGHLSTEARVNVRFVSEVLANVAETSIFAYMGFFLFDGSSSMAWHWSLVFTSIGSIVLSRAFMIVGFGIFILLVRQVVQYIKPCTTTRNGGLPHQDDGITSLRTQTIMIVAGIRGAVSFALVEHVPLYNVVTQTGSRYKSELKVMTSSCILFTVFVCGGITHWLVTKLSSSTTTTNTASSISDNAGVNANDGDEQYRRGTTSTSIDNIVHHDLSLSLMGSNNNEGRITGGNNDNNMEEPLL